MDSFNYKNAVFLHAYLLTAVFPVSGHKIIVRQHHGFAPKKLCQMLIEQRDIYHIHPFKIIRSVRIFRCIFPIHIIIIHGNRNRMKPVHFHLHTKSLIG